MSRFFSLSLVAVVLVGGLTLYWRWPAAVPETAPVTALTVAPMQAAPGEVSAFSAATPDDTQTPVAATLPSLVDTEVDGQLRTDAAGNLVLDLAVRDYFDYFLSAVDHSGLDTVIEALLADAGRRLPEPALGQMISLLGDYLDYKRASMALMQQPLDAQQQIEPKAQLQALQSAFARLDELRRAHFSAAAQEALFGAEQAYARFTLDSLALQQRDDLGEAQRTQMLEQLRERLPDALRASEQRQQLALKQLQRSEQLWRDGADEQQVREFLAMTYDPHTVQRLLDEQRRERDWQQHYQAYRNELASLQGRGLSEADGEQLQRQLRERLFSSEDRHRVETYDAIAAKQPEPLEP
ncbi:lipase secretion chaperone [Pseudomonas berkeleyensis]|uniref:Lipase chaperone n=1 Tax=Pseudomonas berkeleyensis TaxID=2726956 RepID=A0A7G5DUP4_9PSED|nr:lipase secretion chaperone [Pseudomonas berkeleyensis]QMV65469.1 lipase chaperone [Pseudomonas berkeleyensis]WSO40949.1 lipase secretion chaperone [Pseudomonas berkeleyensis]